MEILHENLFSIFLNIGVDKEVVLRWVMRNTM